MYKSIKLCLEQSPWMPAVWCLPPKILVLLRSVHKILWLRFSSPRESYPRAKGLMDAYGLYRSWDILSLMLHHKTFPKPVISNSMAWPSKLFHSIVTILLADCLCSAGRTGWDGSANDTEVIQRFYSSTFVNPTPPTIQTESRANYMQVWQVFLIFGWYKRSRFPNVIAQVRCECQRHRQWICK